MLLVVCVFCVFCCAFFKLKTKINANFQVCVFLGAFFLVLIVRFSCSNCAFFVLLVVLFLCFLLCCSKFEVCAVFLCSSLCSNLCF